MSSGYSRFCRLGYSCSDLAEEIEKNTGAEKCISSTVHSETPPPGYGLALLILAVAQLILTMLLIFSQKIGKA